MLIEWACELTTFSRDDAESHTDVMHSVRYHASLDYASLDVVPEARHEAFVALVYEVAKLREAELAATPEYLSEVVAAAHTSRTLYQRAAAWAQRTGRWVPALEDTLFPIDATPAEAFEALVNGPQMWHVANHSPHATIGYRYATNVDAGHRLARSPLAFWASLALAPEERFLCPDAGYDAAQVAWAVSRVPGNAEVTDLLTALDMAADSAGDA